MIVISGRNVNHTYQESIEKIRRFGVRSDSRNGPVLVADSPVMTVTERPMERVLFDPRRDANPFFHFFECLWMIAGRRDGVWLDQFVRDFSLRFAEPSGDIHGAYGDRWRNWPYTLGDGEEVGENGESTFCQLRTAVSLLTKNPLDRRVVIQMWDPARDLAESVNDVPCNLLMMPRIVNSGFLDLTVVCRSNDIIWGATGANAVHFSFVQEWLASMIGVGVGKMYQLSNNWHAYEETLEKVGDPDHVYDQYSLGGARPMRICQNPETWEIDLEMFMDEPTGSARGYSNSFFEHVALPMLETHRLWRSGRRADAILNTDKIAATDWSLAARQWMQRRIKP